MTSLITLREPPAKRLSKTLGPYEKVLSEAAVMLAFATYAIEVLGATGVEIHPDGEHGKRFDIRGWLESSGFQLETPRGRTSYGGSYVRGTTRLVVDPKSGLGDVAGTTESHRIVAECKGGVLNTNHAGQRSRLRTGLCEAVGLLLARASDERQYAIVPRHAETLRLAERMAPRLGDVGITIGVVDGAGAVEIVS